MFDFLRNLTKSAEEKRQETIAAYVDGALHGRSRQQFEQEMAQDEGLRQDVAQLRLIKQSLRQLPQREVPRNFILDPAKYGRPAPQPWVKAYPVLRTATAMTAFFLIFAFAAGIFTGLGSGEPILVAPAGDVAQVESVEVTRVVTEVTESQAFEAEVETSEEDGDAASDEAEPVEESAAADVAAEAEEAVAMDEEVVVEEAMAEEEMAEEETTEEEAPPAATAVPGLSDTVQEDTTEEGAPASEPVIAPTLALSPTPTVSTLPRVTPPTPLPDREMELEQAQDDGGANDVVADVPEAETSTENVPATAVPAEDEVQATRVSPLFDPLLVLQIGLGVLLLALAGLTFYARRQR
ncbi:MAG: hypothetical protein H6656_11250 [Ardenticatenaceae bacterium]|nr:hypothetical protein [Ardenticatenaceae bacterium]